MELDNLIRDCQKQDRRAQKELFYRYSKQMMYVAYRYTTDHDTAQESVQESFIRIFKGIKSLQGRDEATLLSWMRKITARESLRIVKKSRRISYAEEVDTVGHQSPGVYDKMQSDEVLELLSTMPEGYRTVIQLYAIEGYTHEEIAALLNISVSTSRSQLTRARRMIKHHWHQLNTHHETTT